MNLKQDANYFIFNIYSCPQWKMERHSSLHFWRPVWRKICFLNAPFPLVSEQFKRKHTFSRQRKVRTLCHWKYASSLLSVGSLITFYYSFSKATSLTSIRAPGILWKCTLFTSKLNTFTMKRQLNMKMGWFLRCTSSMYV